MKYKFFFVILLLYSCKPAGINQYEKPVLNSKGFAYVYSLKDLEGSIIKKKINPDNFAIAHNKVKRGVRLKITNPKNGKNIILKNSIKLEYPDFYKVLITKAVSSKIGLNEDFPYVEVEELKKNKSFVAKKAETYEEEKQLKVIAPVEKVKISNIGKKITTKKSTQETKFIIVLGNFYSFESANLLKKRVKTESLLLKNKKITIIKKNKHNFEVFLGPYKTINTMKNDYIALKQINFDEVDIKLYE